MKTLIAILKNRGHSLLNRRNKKAKAVIPVLQNSMIELDEIELYAFHNN
jgi:hypothetical protein